MLILYSSFTLEADVLHPSGGQMDSWSRHYSDLPPSRVFPGRLIKLTNHQSEAQIGPTCMCVLRQELRRSDGRPQPRSVNEHFLEKQICVSSVGIP